MAKRDVTLFEVGPRDGLQNEKRTVSLKDKIWFIRNLEQTGLGEIEVGAFVRPDRVPQMADSAQVVQGIGKFKSARTWVLVPNRVGLEAALSAGARNIAVFTAATDGFAKANIGMTVHQSLAELSKVVAEAHATMKGIAVRGYVSTAFGCPFEGRVPPRKALKVVEKLAEMGVDYVSIGDTIGVATPNQMDQVMMPALKMLGVEGVAGHFHDTNGTALANALRSLEIGVRAFDTSAGGLGGCPFAPGATGNLATEDLVYMLDGMGLKTGVDLERLSRVSLKLAQKMKRPISSRYLQSFAARC